MGRGQLDMDNHDFIKLAVVEDDPDLAALLRMNLEAAGFQVSTFGDALPFLRHVREYGLPHLVLLDLVLPSMHGFEVSERLKALGDVPIIIISTQDEVKTIVKGLVNYADDYITKPFEIEVLVARIRRVLSRIPDFSYAQAPIVRIDDRLSVDFGRSRLMIGTQTIALTPTEASILHILIRNTGHVVAVETLIARVWPGQEVYEDTLRVHMHRLRRKLEPDAHHPRYIQTAHGSGYSFTAEKSDCGSQISSIPDRHNMFQKS
jgi:DNA-binding response OmpR family regulator